MSMEASDFAFNSVRLRVRFAKVPFGLLFSSENREMNENIPEIFAKWTSNFVCVRRKTSRKPSRAIGNGTSIVDRRRSMNRNKRNER